MRGTPLGLISPQLAVRLYLAAGFVRPGKLQGLGSAARWFSVAAKFARNKLRAIADAPRLAFYLA